MAGIFKAYDIRGKYPGEVNETVGKQIGGAFFELVKPKRVLVGKDVRVSSDSLCEAFVEGLSRKGVSIDDMGLTSTPMFYWAMTAGRYDGGAMVTASHLPADKNGFKLCLKGAVPLSSETGLKDVEKLVNHGVELPKAKGEIKSVSYLDKYIEELKKHIDKPIPLRIVIDAGNGTIGQELTELLADMDEWDPTELYMQPDGRFPNHIANPLLESATKDLQEMVVKEKADIGIAFDCDADRVAFIDENGERVPLDIVTAMIAESFLRKESGAAIVYDVRSSHVVAETIEKYGGKAVRSRVGHSFMSEVMRKERAVFGGELSGHYYYRDMGYTDNAIFTMIWMLNHMAAKGQLLSELVSVLKKYYSSGEINIKVKDKDAILDALEKRYTNAKTDRLDGLTVELGDWWFNLRPSHTEAVVRLNLEAASEELMDEKKEEVLRAIGQIEPAMQLA